MAMIESTNAIEFGGRPDVKTAGNDRAPINSQAARRRIVRRPASILWALLLVGMAGGSGAQAADRPDASQGLRFVMAGPELVTFDTGRLRGEIRSNRKSFGLIKVVQAPSGRTVSSSMGLFGVYRVFSDGRRYGAGAWDWPSTAVANPDGSLTVRCPAEEERPFELTGVYRWSDPATLDFEIQVKPSRDLRGFEAFLASYFQAAFTNAAVYAQQKTGADLPPAFVRAEQALGDWLMFPRDRQSVQLMTDGRWKLPPHPVDWRIQPELGSPLAWRRAPDVGLTAVIMASPEHCFGIALPHETEGHYSVYLSLFGRDLPAGKTAIARARLALLENPSAPEILRAYSKFQAPF